MLQLGKVISTYQESTEKELVNKIYNIRNTIQSKSDKNDVPLGCQNFVGIQFKAEQKVEDFNYGIFEYTEKDAKN